MAMNGNAWSDVGELLNTGFSRGLMPQRVVHNLPLDIRHTE
jgi:hypothetical protein